MIQGEELRFTIGMMAYDFDKGARPKSYDKLLSGVTSVVDALEQTDAEKLLDALETVTGKTVTEEQLMKAWQATMGPEA